MYGMVCMLHAWDVILQYNVMPSYSRVGGGRVIFVSFFFFKFIFRRKHLMLLSSGVERWYRVVYVIPIACLKSYFTT